MCKCVNFVKNCCSTNQKRETLGAMLSIIDKVITEFTGTLMNDIPTVKTTTNDLV